MLDLVKKHYAKNRAELEEEGGYIDHLPPVEEVSDEKWAATIAYVEKTRKGRTFTFCHLVTIEGGIEDTLTTHHWDEEMVGCLRQDSHIREFETRPATEEEIVEFVLSGGVEREDEDDAAFDMGWAMAKEDLM